MFSCLFRDQKSPKKIGNKGTRFLSPEESFENAEGCYGILNIWINFFTIKKKHHHAYRYMGKLPDFVLKLSKLKIKDTNDVHMPFRIIFCFAVCICNLFHPRLAHSIVLKKLIEMVVTLLWLYIVVVMSVIKLLPYKQTIVL